MGWNRDLAIQQGRPSFDRSLLALALSCISVQPKDRRMHKAYFNARQTDVMLRGSAVKTSLINISPVKSIYTYKLYGAGCCIAKLNLI